jgi:hypothetical protein
MANFILSLRPLLLVGLLSSFLSGSPSEAQSDGVSIISQLSPNKDILLDNLRICTKADEEKFLKQHSVVSEGYVEDVGIVSPYGVTAHTYYLWKLDDSSRLALAIAHFPNKLGVTPILFCPTVLLFDTGGKKFRINKSLNREHVRDLPDDQLQYISALMLRCEGMGKAAEKFFSMGHYVKADDGSMIAGIPNSFNCDAAVWNNVSALSFRIGNRDIRMTVIFDRLYLVPN